MENNLDTLMQQHIDRNYKRFQNTFEKRINKAKDKLYAIEQYEMRMKATTELRYEWNDEYKSLIDDMEDDYRLGVSVAISIKKLRKEQNNRHLIDNDKSIVLVAYTDENGIRHEIEPDNEPLVLLLDSYTDEDIIRAFAQYKTCELFLEFLDAEKQKYLPMDSQINGYESIITNDEHKKQIAEFTTSRQVLAVHYLMKYYQVRNVDQTAIARFIYFLTGKNYGNIYKLVCNPLKGTFVKNNEDLKYIRKFFEDLGLEEVVKMINNEMI